MGIKEYILQKRQAKKEVDIIETLDTTIKLLEDHVAKINSGEIHNLEKYQGSKNAGFAESMILHEKTIVHNAIQPLKDARATIKRGKVAEEIFHYDFESNGTERHNS